MTEEIQLLLHCKFAQLEAILASRGLGKERKMIQLGHRELAVTGGIRLPDEFGDYAEAPKPPKK